MTERCLLCGYRIAPGTKKCVNSNCADIQEEPDQEHDETLRS